MRTHVDDVMTRDPITVSPEATLRELAEVLSQNHIGGVPVVAAGDRVLGVVSMSDLIDFVAGSSGVPTERLDEMAWGEIDGPPDDAEDPEATAYFADLWSDAGADVLARFSATSGPEWNALEEHTVAEVMTRVVLSVRPDTSVQHAGRLMLDRGVHRLLVLEDGQLLGIVTTKDLVRVLIGPPAVARR